MKRARKLDLLTLLKKKKAPVAAVIEYYQYQKGGLPLKFRKLNEGLEICLKERRL
jgi:translation initiation factor IF-3